MAATAHRGGPAGRRELRRCGNCARRTGARCGPPEPLVPPEPAGGEGAATVRRRTASTRAGAEAAHREPCRGCGRDRRAGNGTGIPGIGRRFAGERGSRLAGSERRRSVGRGSRRATRRSGDRRDGMAEASRGGSARHVDADSIQEIGDGVLHRSGSAPAAASPPVVATATANVAATSIARRNRRARLTRRRVWRSEWDHRGALGLVTEPRGEVAARFRCGQPAVRVPHLHDEGMHGRERVVVGEGCRPDRRGGRSRCSSWLAFEDGVGAQRRRDVAGLSPFPVTCGGCWRPLESGGRRRSATRGRRVDRV